MIWTARNSHDNITRRKAALCALPGLPLPWMAYLCQFNFHRSFFLFFFISMGNIKPSLVQNTKNQE